MCTSGKQSCSVISPVPAFLPVMRQIKLQLLSETRLRVSGRACAAHPSSSSASHPLRPWTRTSVEKEKKKHKCNTVNIMRAIFPSHEKKNTIHTAALTAPPPLFVDHRLWFQVRPSPLSFPQAMLILDGGQAKGKPPVYQQQSSWPQLCSWKGDCACFCDEWWGLKVIMYSGSCVDPIIFHGKWTNSLGVVNSVLFWLCFPGQ